MTPYDALRAALDAQGVDDNVDPLELASVLRLLGFTIVPVEPTDAQVEAMAKALAEGQGFYDSYDFDNHLVPAEAAESFRNFARAAYAAAVKEASGD